MNETLEKLLKQSGFELVTKTLCGRTDKVLYYKGNPVPNTMNKSDDYYIGFLQGCYRGQHLW